MIKLQRERTKIAETTKLNAKETYKVA